MSPAQCTQPSGSHVPKTLLLPPTKNNVKCGGFISYTLYQLWEVLLSTLQLMPREETRLKLCKTMGPQCAARGKVLLKMLFFLLFNYCTNSTGLRAIVNTRFSSQPKGYISFSWSKFILLVPFLVQEEIITHVGCFSLEFELGYKQEVRRLKKQKPFQKCLKKGN